MKKPKFLIEGTDLVEASNKSESKLFIDEKAKSLSYFCRQDLVLIDKSAIQELLRISWERGKVNARICLHNSPNNRLHDMVILEYQHRKCRKPHKHLEKPETLQMIEGKMMVLLFSENGSLLEKIALEQEKNFMFRIPLNLYHLYLPISDYVIYKETKLGPFALDDNIPPKWNYARILKKHIDFLDLRCSNNSCKNPCSLSKYKNK